MKHAAFALLLLLPACASKIDIERPEIQVVELFGPSDLNFARGQNQLHARYGFVVTNPSKHPITLKRIDLRSYGEGAYWIRPEERPFDVRIESGDTGQVEMSALVYFQGRPLGNVSSEPVSARATLFFDSPVGKFQQVKMQMLTQFGR